jgi:hypothetical protein
MSWHIEYSFPLGAKGTIFDPVGDGSGYFPRLMFVYTKEGAKKKEAKAPTNGQAGAGGGAPGFLDIVKSLGSRRPVFGFEGSAAFGDKEYSAIDSFRTLFKDADVNGYSKASEEGKLDILKGYAEKQGVDVKFMGYNDLASEHGDCQAYRIGSTAKIGLDYRGKAHTAAELRALLLHELMSGYDHRDGDAVAQKKAKAFAEKHGDHEALAYLKEIDGLLVKKGIASAHELN